MAKLAKNEQIFTKRDFFLFHSLVVNQKSLLTSGCSLSRYLTFCIMNNLTKNRSFGNTLKWANPYCITLWIHIYDTWSYSKLLENIFFCLEVVRTSGFCWLVCAIMIRHARKLVLTQWLSISERKYKIFTVNLYLILLER